MHKARCSENCLEARLSSCCVSPPSLPTLPFLTNNPTSRQSMSSTTALVTMCAVSPFLLQLDHKVPGMGTRDNLRFFSAKCPWAVGGKIQKKGGGGSKLRKICRKCFVYHTQIGNVPNQIRIVYSWKTYLNEDIPCPCSNSIHFFLIRMPKGQHSTYPPIISSVFI
jgi:hypothetical protein